MKKDLKKILLLSAIFPLNSFALCIGPCTPNYSPMPVNRMVNSNNDNLPSITIARHQQSYYKNQTTFAEQVVKQNKNNRTVASLPNNSNSLMHEPINLTTTPVAPNNVAKENVEITASSPYLKYFNSDDPNRFDSSNHISNPFNFSLYKPTYIIPLFYNFKIPNSAVAVESMEQGTFPIAHPEFDFQISFKVPLWQDIFVWPDTLYVAYTQDSFWQLYTDDPYFRETDYEPEVFLDNEIDKSLGDGWYFSDLDLGAMHQSNGRGGVTERSWNRAYFETVFNNGNWMVSIQPWTPIFAKESSDEHNPDITHFLGYGQEMLAYNYDNNTISLTTRNDLESGFTRGAEWLTWSFPLLHRNIKGYVYLFSGYGYDLIDYNHYLNGVGLGITLNDWM